MSATIERPTVVTVGQDGSTQTQKWTFGGDTAFADARAYIENEYPYQGYMTTVLESRTDAQGRLVVKTHRFLSCD